MLYDLAQGVGADWNTIEGAILADPMVANQHNKPVHKTGRGAGGHCFIKDYAAFSEFYKKYVPEDSHGHNILDANTKKNIKLLMSTGKDLDLLLGVHGEIDENKI